eukprot:m.183488 g.183488  ORF g.183488 m.183488 type:complete len:537 (-) comp53500_c1_seq3:33-1643(-)
MHGGGVLSFRCVILAALLHLASAAACPCDGGGTCANLTLAQVPSCLPTNITELDLSMNGLTSLEANVFAMFASLENLTLAQNDLTIIQPNAFAGLSSLLNLNLSYNSLTSLEVNTFAGLSSLSFLEVTYNNMLTTIGASAFVGLPNLGIIYLYSNGLTSISDFAFAGLQKLRVLWLGGNMLTSLSTDVFAGLPSMEAIDLTENKFTTLSANTFGKIPSLKGLYMVRNLLKSLSVDSLANLTMLNTLELSTNSLTSISTGTFRSLRAAVFISLDGNHLASISAGTFSQMTALTDLNLSNNPDLKLIEAGAMPAQATNRTVFAVGCSKGPNSACNLPQCLQRLGNVTLRLNSTTGACWEVESPHTATRLGLILGATLGAGAGLIACIAAAIYYRARKRAGHASASITSSSNDPEALRIPLLRRTSESTDSFTVSTTVRAHRAVMVRFRSHESAEALTSALACGPCLLSCRSSSFLKSNHSHDRSEGLSDRSTNQMYTGPTRPRPRPWSLPRSRLPGFKQTPGQLAIRSTLFRFPTQGI